MPRLRPPNASSDPSAELGFLLSQVGAHASSRFAERLVPLDLKPPHAGILRILKQADGLSQQALGERLGVFPSRLVGLIDELEERGLVERRDCPTDRRSYALHLTAAGQDAWSRIGNIAREHLDALCAALDRSERVQLASLLRRIADQQQLTPGVHPGYRRLDGPQDQNPCP